MDELHSFLLLIAGMTPYLMLGFLFSGILHVVVPHQFYKKHLSQNNAKSIALAALFGIPLPLCSCGVLPTAMSLRKEGASKSATVSFMTATPQTGIDSILATYSVFGWAFTIIRPVAALVTSVFSGGMVALFERNSEETEDCGAEGCEPCEKEGRKNPVVEALRYGYVTMLQDIGTHLVVGLLIAGAIAIFVPDSFLLRFAGMPLLEMLLVTLIAIPMYVCATGSIPIAAALMLKGMSPGAALVLLMAGPAVSFASMVVVRKVLGTRTLAIYIASIVLGAMAFGLCIDYLLPQDWFSVASMPMSCHKNMLPMWKTVTAVVFFILLTNALLLKYKPEKQKVMESTVTYKVKGMSCNHCKMSVETNVAKLQGVASATVDLAAGTVAVQGTAAEDEIRAAIESLGFEFGGRI